MGRASHDTHGTIERKTCDHDRPVDPAARALGGGRRAMWAVLRDPCHAETFQNLGETFAPMRGLVGHLARRPYGSDLFAFTSMACFVLTTAPGYRDAEGHDRIAIDFDPDPGLFTVRYCEWLSPTRNPSHRAVACRTCEWPEIADVIDLYVLRLIILRRPG